jgi:hypothetical protein
MSKDIKQSFLPLEEKVCPLKLEVTMTIDINGSKIWKNKKGEIHRDNDLPAIEYYNGTKVWYQYGKRHRDNDLPAIEFIDGTKEWYQYGKRHRDNGKPAFVAFNGNKEWFINDIQIRFK